MAGRSVSYGHINRASSSPGRHSSTSSPVRRRSTTSGSRLISTPTPIRILRPVVEPPEGRGLIDTSVVIRYSEVEPRRLPAEMAISTLTLAELTAGPLAATDELERARRQERLQRFETGVETLTFSPSCARAYGHIYAAT